MEKFRQSPKTNGSKMMKVALSGFQVVAFIVKVLTQMINGWLDNKLKMKLFSTCPEICYKDNHCTHFVYTNVYCHLKELRTVDMHRRKLQFIINLVVREVS